jgi:O-antigen ligase
VFLAALLLWWIVYVVNILYLGGSAGLAADATETGAALNQIQVMSFGILGMAGAGRAIKRLNSRLTWPFFYLLYTTWATASILWTSESTLTVKRLGVFIMVSIGAIGIGAGQYGGAGGPLRLVRHLRWAGIIAAAFSLPILATELSFQTLLDPTWRTILSTKGPELGVAVSFSVIASAALAWGPNDDNRLSSRSRTATLTRLSLFGLLALLIILKSRSLIAFTLLAVAGIYLLQKKMTPAFIASSSLLVFISIVLGILGLRMFGEQLFVFLARQESLNTLNQLNGRTPLWSLVWNDITQRPWTGAGFGAYWNPSRLRFVWAAVGWTAPFAHNGYLDELAGTGILGLTLLLSVFAAAGRDLIRRLRTGTADLAVRVTIGWLAILLLINTVDSVFQFYFKVPYLFFLALLSSCSAASAASRARVIGRGPRFHVPIKQPVGATGIKMGDGNR